MSVFGSPAEDRHLDPPFFRAYTSVPMASDAHAHPHDLSGRDAEAETLRRSLGVVCAASAWNEKEFLYQEGLSSAALADGSPMMVPCFGVHPQLAAESPSSCAVSLAFLRSLVAGKRIGAVGEIGVDLYGERYRSVRSEQARLFDEQLELALEGNLPAVLHLRRATDQAFARKRILARLPAVVFHSFSGTLAEAHSLLDRGIQAYFSFGAPIALNHKKAIASCAGVPLDRLLVETDAPYQPFTGPNYHTGRDYSDWSDLRLVLAEVARLRSVDVSEIERATDANFRKAYGIVD